jgi:complement component 1 Q subcomponent-binding protein, mitochondrial
MSSRIRISFSIADLSTFEQDADQFSDDPALYDEEASGVQSGSPGSTGTANQGGNLGTAPEDGVAPASREELADDESPVDRDEQEPGFPARLTITIEKPGVKGAIQVESVAQDGMIAIENVYYYRDRKLAEAKTVEDDWTRRALYTGPPYGNLDQDLQALLEKYLDERGINTALALWVPEYIDYKEQREYVKWLAGKHPSETRIADTLTSATDIKGFVDA